MECCDGVEVIVGAGEGGGEVGVGVCGGQFGAGLGERRGEGAGGVEGLVAVGGFVPRWGPDRALGRGGVEVGLVAELPIIELAIFESCASQRHRG